jgi:peptidase S41-like protein
MVRENAAEELGQEVESLVQQGMRVLLLDLRSNPGGLRDEAVEAADLFLDPRQKILVSRAAEIIAGALQDHDRALIVGDTTYGKGIVQTVFTLSHDLALRMTTARWYVLGLDTLTTSESLFAQSLGEQIPVFRDVLTAYALELKKGRSVASEQFQVTPAMRLEVQRRLQSRSWTSSWATR